MTPNFKELNAGKRCATLMDTFHDLERVHDHLIDNLNLEILELEIWSKLYGRRIPTVGISGRVSGNVLT